MESFRLPDIDSAYEVPNAFAMENFEELGWCDPIFERPMKSPVRDVKLLSDDATIPVFDELPLSDAYDRLGVFESEGLLGSAEDLDRFPPQERASSIRRSRGEERIPVDSKRQKYDFNDGEVQIWPQEYHEYSQIADRRQPSKGLGGRLNRAPWSGAAGRLHMKREKTARRAKWTRPEVLKLWKAISKYGNNWVQIEHCLSDESRTYEQVKDKGRRILFQQGWRTGRKKQKATEAMDSAKEIANKQIQEHGKAPFKKLFTRKTSARSVKAGNVVHS